ncbi:MAG: hypothetical protein HZC28_00695 [Spirochaetes bacterium]|nr:hypothetical protein [Spirochaetota bacterium]
MNAYKALTAVITAAILISCIPHERTNPLDPNAATNFVVIWTKTFGTTTDDVAVTALNLSFDNVFIIGYTAETGTTNVCTLTVSEDGALVSRAIYTNGSNIIPCAAVKTAGNNIYIAGRCTSSGDNDMLLMKVASNGTLLWQSNFGSSSVNEYANAVVEQSNNDCVLVGGLSNTGGWALAVSTNGAILWQSYYPLEPLQCMAADGYGGAVCGSGSNIAVFRITNGGGVAWKENTFTGTATAGTVVSITGDERIPYTFYFTGRISGASSSTNLFGYISRSGYSASLKQLVFPGTAVCIGYSNMNDIGVLACGSVTPGAQYDIRYSSLFPDRVIEITTNMNGDGAAWVGDLDYSYTNFDRFKAIRISNRNCSAVRLLPAQNYDMLVIGNATNVSGADIFITRMKLK